MKHLLLSIALLLLSPPALAGGGSMASQSVNLLLLIAALVLVARKPISKIFAERATKIKAQLEKGQKMLDAAKAREAEIDAKLAALESRKPRLSLKQKQMPSCSEMILSSRLKLSESVLRSRQDALLKMSPAKPKQSCREKLRSWHLT